MNITKKEIDSLNFTLLMEIAPVDYAENVDKQLHKMRSKVNMPGFRPGMVPFGLVKKMYQKSVMADEINNLLSKNLQEYVENNMNVLGEPMPNDEQTKANFDTDETFTFAFDLAVAPEFDAAITAKDDITEYDIKVDDDMIERQIEQVRQRFGKSVTADEVQDRDLVKGTLTELCDGEPKEGGIVKENAIMSPERMKDEQKKSFIGQKVGSKIVFNPKTAFDNDAEIASLLGITKDEAAAMQSDFCFELKEVTRFEAAEINQQLFDNAYGEGKVKDEAEFRTKVTEQIKEQLKQDEAYRFGIDARAAVMKKMEGLQFPDDFLKKWLLATDKSKKLTREEVDKDYPKMLDELKWTLAKNQIGSAHEVKVEENDIKEYAKLMTRMQFAQYGLTGLDDAMIEQYAAEQLKREDQVRGIFDRVYENKVIEIIKQNAKIKTKKISVADFNKLFENDK